MARVVRSRSRVATLNGTRLKLANGTVVQTTPISVTRTSTCTDYIGRPVTNSPFNSVQHTLGLVLNGSFGSGTTPATRVEYKYQQVPQQPLGTSVNASLLGVPNGWYLDTIARSNPSRPVLTPLTLIQDFVELPGMVRHVGNLLTTPARSLGAKDLANQNLAMQFGWLPLVDDVNKLLNLQSLVQRKVEDIRQLYSGRGLRGKVKITEDSQVGVTQYHESITGFDHLWYYTDDICHRRMWATIRWKPTTVPPSLPSDADMNRLARKVVLGLTREGLVKGAWDVIPWTWLLGWFNNVGNFILVNSNTVPAQHSQACLMNEVEMTSIPSRVFTTGTANFCDVTFGRPYVYTVKTRTVSGGVTTGFNVPFVDTNRLSILGSLYVQRFLR